MKLTHPPVAKAEMLIHRPVAEVFNAFVDSEVTTKFWFTKSSGRMEEGRQVTWEWEMYQVSTPVTVKALEPNRRILIEWWGGTTVEWIFTSRPDGSTFVSVTNAGFTGDGDEMFKEAIQSTEGFTIVLAGLKALLEHNVALNLVGDRFA